MKTSSKRARRSLGAAFAGSAAGGVVALALALPSTPSATAATDPCAASEVARTLGSVAMSTGNYLDSHPNTNQALTTISQQQPGPQSLATLKAYFDANPQAAKDMQQLQAPLVGLSTRCKLPLTLPQLLGLTQSAPGGLPALSQAAQTAAAPGARVPPQRGPAGVVTQGSGPLPGPSARVTG